MPGRFFARGITLTFALATFLGRCLDNLTIDAAPTSWRRSRRRSWPMNWRWARKRPLPTRRVFRRTGRMRAGRTMPLVTTATFFPPPATAILNPTPLATLIVPLPARDRLRRQFESVLVAVLSNAIAYNDQRIADRARDSEDFELRLRKIAERI